MLPAILFASAIFFLWVGYQVKYKGHLNLIAGHEGLDEISRPKAIRWVGGNILLLGISGLLASLGALLFTEYAANILATFCSLILIVTFVTALGEDLKGY